jgi:hypothetical protein
LVLHAWFVAAKALLALHAPVLLGVANSWARHAFGGG